VISLLKNRVVAVSVVAALQLAALGYMAVEREYRVRHGRDIVLDVIPVDPRSLFQGDYVILGYDISSIPSANNTQEVAGSTVYVTLAPQADGKWKYVRHSSWQPSLSDVPGSVVLKGRIERASSEFLRVTYGLERYFVPEGKGRALETLVLDKKLSAVVSVWRDGSSMLKGLMSEGKVLYETGIAAKQPEEVPPLDPTAPVAVDAVPTEAVPAPQPEAVPQDASPAPADASPPAPATPAP
jgi:uncharacterized membrane-anchored protein